MKIVTFLTSLLVCMTVIGCTTQNEDMSSGASSLDGSSLNQPSQGHISDSDVEWILITSETELHAIGTSETYPLSGRYLLDSDITLSKEVDWIPIGTKDAPFTGVFNGNGDEIIDLTIKDKNTNPIGMFAYCEGAQVYNLTLRKLDYMSAFQDGDSIAPFVVFGGNNTQVYDVELIDFVE